MKIIVTGGTGFLGRHVVWRLAALGHEVTFTGRQHEMAEQVLEHSPASVKFACLHHAQDNSQQRLNDLAQGMDAIVHCAALSSPWGKFEDFFQANVVSTQEVLAACKLANIQRLVHISTPSLYFDYRDRLNIQEDEPLPLPVNHYARTKGIAELLVMNSSITQRVILRPRALFGPWDNTLMPRLLRVIKEGAIPLMHGGKAKLDITYIDNAVDAIVLALTKPLAKPLSIYNVTNGEPLCLDQLLAHLAKEFKLALRTRRVPWCLVKAVAWFMEKYSLLTQGREPFVTRYSAGVLAFSQTLDISAIRDELGYQPAVSITQGLARHALWLDQQRCVDKDQSALLKTTPSTSNITPAVSNNRQGKL